MLVPVTEQDAEQFETWVRNGSWYKTTLAKARNPEHHRKAFALIKLILDSQERYQKIEDLLVELKIKAGWYDEFVRPTDSPGLIRLAKFAASCPAPIRRKLEGYIELLRAEAGLVYVPRSISFADMGQLEFEQFYDRLIDIAKDEYGLEEALSFL